MKKEDVISNDTHTFEVNGRTISIDYEKDNLEQLVSYFEDMIIQLFDNYNNVYGEDDFFDTLENVGNTTCSGLHDEEEKLEI